MRHGKRKQMRSTSGRGLCGLRVDDAETVMNGTHPEHRFSQPRGFTARERTRRRSFQRHLAIADMDDDLTVSGQRASLHGLRDRKLQLHIARRFGLTLYSYGTRRNCAERSGRLIGTNGKNAHGNENRDRQVPHAAPPLIESMEMESYPSAASVGNWGNP